MSPIISCVSLCSASWNICTGRKRSPQGQCVSATGNTAMFSVAEHRAHTRNTLPPRRTARPMRVANAQRSETLFPLLRLVFSLRPSSHTLFLNRAVQRTLFSKQRTVFSSLFVRGSSLPTSYLEAKRGLCGTASSSDEGDRKEQTASVCNRRCAMAPRSPTDLRLAHHAVLALGLFSLCPCCTGQRRGEGEREGE